MTKLNTIPPEIFEIIISYYQWDDLKEIIHIILTCHNFSEYIKYVKDYSKKMILRIIEQKLDNDNEFHFKMMQNIHNKKCINCAIIDNLGKVCNQPSILPSQLVVEDENSYFQISNNKFVCNKKCCAITCKDCNLSCYYCGFCKCDKCEPNGISNLACCGRNVCKECIFNCTIFEKNNIVICNECTFKNKIFLNYMIGM